MPNENYPPPKPRTPRLPDSAMVGVRFGRFLVLARWHMDYWLCVCKCSTFSIAYGVALRCGNTKSCGCLHLERVRENGKKNGTHRRSRTPEYHSWFGMIDRCYNPDRKYYRNYGGRGITVCDRWRHSFENFLADMGLRTSPQHTLDRYPDNDGPYSPENCRWATRREQALNNRRTVFATVDGITKPTMQWAEEFGLNSETIRKRITVYGYTGEEAISVPVEHGRTKARRALGR